MPRREVGYKTTDTTDTSNLGFGSRDSVVSQPGCSTIVIGQAGSSAKERRSRRRTAQVYWDTAVCDPSLEGIGTALRYVAELVGVEHVVLGSDYDGSTEVPFDSSELPALTQHLLGMGFSKDDVERIMGQNTINFLLENLPRGAP